jgi:serine protease AprX
MRGLNVIQWRQTLAGGLTAAVCVFGLVVSADAATKGRGARHQNRRSVVTGQDAPRYDGRKSDDHAKLDRQLNARARIGGLGRSRAIVVLKPGCSIDAAITQNGGKKGQRLGVINGQLVELPNRVLRKLADNPCVASIHWDRKLGSEMNRAAVTLGARAVQQQLGFDGAGVGIAIIDSGVTSFHDDLTYHGSNPLVQVVGNQRVVKFVDFVNGYTNKYDDNGHGSHVAGIVAGNGWDTMGSRAGIAPAANLVSLKVLDAQGGGYISNVIAALDWVVANKTAYRIRVVNLSVGAAVTESYLTDPLTLAAKRVVDAGVVVVTAAGNLGKKNGHIQYGGITAPGNAPWVLTVGADSHMGTTTRTDDTMTTYSSRGPTWMDFNAKPDVVAPGTGIVSLSVVNSLLYNDHPTYRMAGSLGTLLGGAKPYLSLTGTSMAAPMVTGTVALMMQANPNLTPNLAKAIIEYTAQNYNYGKLAQGAGFLNTEGAVKLASYFATAQPGSIYPTNPAWSRTLVWGNRKVKSGVIKPQGSAYSQNVVWGATQNEDGDNIVWGTHCPNGEDCDNIVWGTSAVEASNIVWGTFDQAGDGVVWGTSGTGNPEDEDNIVWGTACGEGEDCDNIVWGTECGGEDCDNIVWGTNCDGSEDCENIVWGTACAPGEDCENVVWGSTCDPGEDCDNIVWGTVAGEDEDNIVWGTNCAPGEDCDNIVWGTSALDAPPLYDDPDVPTAFDDIPFEALFGELFFPPVGQQNPPPPPAEPTPSTNPGGGVL